jgi:hypothetical protein
VCRKKRLCLSEAKELWVNIRGPAKPDDGRTPASSTPAAKDPQICCDPELDQEVRPGSRTYLLQADSMKGPRSWLTRFLIARSGASPSSKDSGVHVSSLAD